MGFKVTKLENVPRGGRMNLFIYVLEPSHEHMYSQWLRESFDRIGRDLGERGAIVAGYDNGLTQEIMSYLSAQFNDVPWDLMSFVSFLVSERPLHDQMQGGSVWIIPLAHIDEKVANGEVLAERLLSHIYTAAVEGNLRTSIEELGCVKLRCGGGGVLVSTLRYINRYFVLAPNLAGVGVNLNHAIEDWVRKIERGDR